MTQSLTSSMNDFVGEETVRYLQVDNSSAQVSAAKVSATAPIADSFPTHTSVNVGDATSILEINAEQIESHVRYTHTQLVSFLLFSPLAHTHSMFVTT